MTEISASVPSVPEGSAPASLESIPAKNTIQSAPQKLKIDWEDGNAEELTAEDLISNYKLTRRQAEQLKRQMDPVMQFLQGLQGGDLDSLTNLNIPEDRMLDFAERVLTKKLEYEQMSPQQKAFLQREKEFAEKEQAYRDWQAQHESKGFKPGSN
jgi:phage/plasmid-associated DNA primase